MMRSLSKDGSNQWLTPSEWHKLLVPNAAEEKGKCINLEISIGFEKKQEFVGTGRFYPIQ